MVGSPVQNGAQQTGFSMFDSSLNFPQQAGLHPAATEDSSSPLPLISPSRGPNSRSISRAASFAGGQRHSSQERPFYEATQPINEQSPPTKSAYTQALHTPTNASRMSTSRGYDDTMPTLADETSLSMATDSTLSELSFSPFRMEGKLLQSSPGGQKTFDESSAFFSDFSALHQAQAPLESTPRRLVPTLGPATLPRTAKSWSKDGLAEAGQQEVKNDAETKTADEINILRLRLQESESQNDRLYHWCQELLKQVAAAKEASASAAQQQPIPSPTSSTTAAPAPGAMWTGPRASVPTFFPPSPSLQSVGDWSNGRLTPVPVDGCASPSMNYIGLSLINSMQAQLQSGTDGNTATPGTPIRRGSSISTSAHRAGGSPGPGYYPMPSPSELAGYSPNFNGSTGSLSPAWLQHQQRQAAIAASHQGDRSLPENARGGFGNLPVRPRMSAPPAANLPYMANSFRSSTPSTMVNGHDSPMRFGPAVDSHASAEVLVARAVAGRSQETSIILQQQLKSGNAERQAAIISAIRPHLLTLSEDKHGNFLVQRAIGVDREVAWMLSGSFVRLALSQYGCHVVQRALDEEEPLKKQIVEELLSRNLLESLTSRNSVHVWAKALEIRWTEDGFRRHVFQVINDAMAGRWADTAMQETGSIVVQNLFESAQEDEKKDCVSEILDRLPECAANQWGVWVVQHIIEHGSSESRKLAFQKLLSEAASLSMAQFGQKAIMTALKSKDADFNAGYLDQLCDNIEGSTSPRGTAINTGSPRRSMLVDVAATPQGLQIMTQLLTTVSRDDRERIIKAVRKNSVFLKGTKTGLKVVALTERARAFTGY